MTILLRCKQCNYDLLGGKNEYLFLCPNCHALYLLINEKLTYIDSYITTDTTNYNMLLPFLLFHTEIEYIHFATNKQKDVSIKCGVNPIVVVRAFSMIDPIYFGDLEVNITLSLNKLQMKIIPYKPATKNFVMDIKPEVLEKLSRYTFLKYLDIQADITGLKYSYRVESSSILFLKGEIKADKILIHELKQELPIFSILSI
ncbi:MAG: hypothetical protein N2746_06560 [Deltaproteobacteria bacterium]|nr:hypothetical protein [Deltaproteobacteria bacterium]